MRSALITLLALLVAASAPAVVVNLAPDFAILAASEKARSLRNLRGQPVVLVIADTAKNKSLRKQLKNIEQIYAELASEQIVLVAAIADSDGTVPSNIPVAVAKDGAAVAGAYGVAKGFKLAIIGRDGNLDYQTDRVATAERVRDVIRNSFVVQESGRKQPQP